MKNPAVGDPPYNISAYKSELIRRLELGAKHMLYVIITSNEIVGNIYKVNRGRRCAFIDVQEHQMVQMLRRHR